jgi:hypothetical protein
MTQAIPSASPASFASELAVLLIEKESNQAEAAERQRDAARHAFLENAQRQVDALHDAASATMTGALVGASLSIAGGACQIGAAGFQYEVDMGKAYSSCASEIAQNQLNAGILAGLADVSGKLAEPVGVLVGDSTAARYQAEAKRHEQLAEQARWQASDANGAIDKADQRGDKLLDLLQNIQQSQNSTANSIIGRI